MRSVLGIVILSDAPAVLRQRLVDTARNRQSMAVHLCNSYTLSLAARDSQLRASLGGSRDVNFADGTPVSWVLRMKGARASRPLRGPSLLEDCLRDGIEWGARHFFYGSSTEVLAKLRDSISDRFPNALIVGSISPPYGPVNDIKIGQHIEEINASQPNYVWIGLGTPKQDIFAHRYAASVSAPLVAVGAAFDFIAGAKKEAPTWMRGYGVEWMFRLASEPRRLWRRYWFSGVTFVHLNLIELFRSIAELGRARRAEK